MVPVCCLRVEKGLLALELMALQLNFLLYPVAVLIWLHLLYIDMYVYKCVYVCVWEREREGTCACVYIPLCNTRNMYMCMRECLSECACAAWPKQISSISCIYFLSRMSYQTKGLFLVCVWVRPFDPALLACFWEWLFLWIPISLLAWTLCWHLATDWHLVWYSWVRKIMANTSNSRVVCVPSLCLCMCVCVCVYAHMYVHVYMYIT